MRYLSIQIFILLVVLSHPTEAQELTEDASQLEKEMTAASKLAREYQVGGVNDKAVYYGLKALELARKTKNKEIIFNELLRVSGIESDAGFYDRSIKRLLEAEEIDTSSITLKRMSWPYARLFIGVNAPRLALDKLIEFPDQHIPAIAKLYTKLGMHDSAIYHYRILMEKKPIHYHENNNLGIAYAANNNLDSGLYYYYRALELVNSEKDFMYGMINGNIGSLYSKNNMYQKAAPHLKIDFEISEKVKEYEIHINVGELLYRAYISTGKNKSANEVLNNMLLYKNRLSIEAELAIARIELLHFKERDNTVNYNQRFKSYEKLNNKYLKSIQEKVQSTAEALSGARIKQIETEKAMLNQQLIIEQNAKKRSQLKNGLIILGLLLGVLLIIFFFWRYRIIQSKKAALKEVQLKLAKQREEILARKVKEETRNVQTLSLELIAKQNFSERVIEELSEIENVSKTELIAMELFIQNELEIKSTRAELEVEMGDLSGEFYRLLKINHPDLSDADIKLAAMIALRMTNKEIGISKNMTAETVRTTKYRLKKKMDLANEQDLFDFLNEYLT